MERKPASRILIGVIIVCIILAADFILQKKYNPVPDGTRYLLRMIITFIGVLAACIIYSKQSGVGLPFGELFSYGFKTTALIAFLMALYTFIIYKLIFPMPSAAEMDAAVKAIEQQGNALHNEAVQQAATDAKNRWVVYVSFSIFATLIPGLLGSLAGGAIGAIKKKNQ